MTSTAAQLTASRTIGLEPGVSWLSLLARTTLGVERVATVMVEVSLGKTRLGAGSYRLVVQSYRSQNVRGARPLGSVQRVVTAAEIKRGVRLSMVELGATSTDEPYLVAWLEAGDSALEFDARRARPARGALVAMARAVRGVNPVKIVLG
ncbi:MAG: hypothetical protein EOO75_08540 [Myxococcales bacterium]|nr:MAG: hypothetical protein EOO75_08540 [Myxococcales bacterium]